MKGTACHFDFRMHGLRIVVPLIQILLFHRVEYINAGGNIPGVEVSIPPSHTALSGDLHIQVTSSSFPPLLLQLTRLDGDITQTLTTFPIFPEARALSLNKTIVKIPCGYFSKGGQYIVLIKKQTQPYSYNNSNNNKSSSSSSSDGNDEEVITKVIDVRWPLPQLSLTPEHVQTYPESPVMAILEFPEAVCPPVADSPAIALPEFWLELHYCGHSLLTCDSHATSVNQTNIQVLYSEQVRGFPGRRVLTLRCELFGLAGHYALFLRPTANIPTIPHTAAYVKADWSEQFVFNVHARSIFPCDAHNGGIQVLFQYPSCILASGDRVRLFARLRANVASLAPPTTLEYVAEQRITRGQHSLHFDCDLFTERYVEYCFVYVSQAITGAVADVRMDCVPTLPVTDSESGGWGLWSPWTPCSSTCIGGTRNRYRFCDSPPPRYGAKFCEGPAFETERCGTGIGNSWECFYRNGGISSNEIAAEIPEVKAEVGPFCRCGCIVHLGHAKPKRLLATSSQSCPGRTFWLIQADEDYIIQFKVEQFRLPCGTQWLKVRDGNSTASALLEDLAGSPGSTPSVVNSTGRNILLEFFTEEIVAGGSFCSGGFLAFAVQIRPEKNSTSVPIAQGIGVVPTIALKLTAVHIAAIFFLSGLFIATALLGAQYVFRYRKYHVARAEDLDSLADPTASSTSIPLRNRASSNSTLLSEVISLTRLRPHIKTRNKHSRLRESIDCDEQEINLTKECESISTSTITLTQQETSTTGLPQTYSETDDITAYSLPTTPNPQSCNSSSTGTLRRSSTIVSSEKDKSIDPDSKKIYTRRLSNVSTSTLTNVSNRGDEHAKSDPGCYSPAASVISTATIRTTNLKENKEKRNREKLLAAGMVNGSDFSIACNDVDLEMDYYDYNVVNAGAAPGSYLGMDPAFLVWIPPLDESGEILPEREQLYEDIKPKQYIDPGSNQESPEQEITLPKSRVLSISEGALKCSPIMNQKINNRIHPLIDNKPISNECILKLNNLTKHENNNPKRIVSIQLHEFPKVKLGSPVRVHREKETRVEKVTSCLDSNIINDDIKFADDDDDDEDGNDIDTIEEDQSVVNECNIELSYQDKILSSS